MLTASNGNTGLFDALLGDGRPALVLTGVSLLLTGLFALLLAATGHFLPHDASYLGMSSTELCARHECRIVHFMIHDRASFGGALIALGVFYLWLAEFPLRRGEAWAWWLFALSGAAGFGSFLAYLGYGYLDTWHGTATLLLLPVFLLGLIRTRRLIRGKPLDLLSLAVRVPWTSCFGLGRGLLLFVGLGLVGAGSTILFVGMTSVFVPQDLQYMGLQPADLQAVNPRLIPLIAHDRAGFGGAVCVSGVLVLGVVWFGGPSRAWFQALAVAGVMGFGPAIGVHPAIGYTDPLHLAPAVLGSIGYFLGLELCRRGVRSLPESAGAS